MNRLANNRGYLCGAMDRAPDGGLEWRARIREELKDLGVLWMDPTRKPIELGVEDIENRKYRASCRESHNWNAVQGDMKIIRAVDLRMLNISDFVIVNLDMEVHSCGTYEELYVANRQKKPIILHVEQGKAACPDWLFGVLPHQMVFSTWEEIHIYLRHIAHDPVIEDYRRWMFFDFTLCK